MADLNLKPLFKYPDTVYALISFLEASIKAMKTGQVEPLRHFLQVRLQDKTDRSHLVIIMTKWITLLRMGMGETEKGAHDVEGEMPLGYIPSKFKGKVVLRQVIEPTKAFADKVTTKLKYKDVPVKVHPKYVNQDIALESFSVPTPVRELSFKMSRAHRLVQAALEELSLSDDDWSNEIRTGLQYEDLNGSFLGRVSCYDLLEDLETITNPMGLEDRGSASHISLESVNGGLPLFLGLLVKSLPRLIKRLEQGPLAEKYPKLLKALKAVQQVVEVIQSDK